MYYGINNTVFRFPGFVWIMNGKHLNGATSINQLIVPLGAINLWSNKTKAAPFLTQPISWNLLFPFTTQMLLHA